MTAPRIKSGGKSGDGELAPQPHGGAIRRGSRPGNTPGSGRVPSHIRRLAARLFDEGLDKVLGPAIDGRVHVVLGFESDEALARVVYEAHQRASRPRCRVKPWEALPASKRRPWITAAVKARKSALPPQHIVLEATLAERVRAMDILGKYGVGKSDDLTVVHPDVQLRLQRQAETIARRDTWTRDELFVALDRIWT